MSEKINLELGDIQTTLLLPLWGRAVETEKKSPLLLDNAALELINKINYDFSTISKKITQISQRGWVIRSLLIDKIIRQFIKCHPNATIVNIGCGLDTTFERINNDKILWYDLDLPDVIKLRRKLIQENKKRKYIATSFLDNKWLEQLDIEGNVLFIAAGVLYYFEENQIREFFIKIADLYLDSEFVFDASSPIGVRMANKMVIKNSGMDLNSFLKWGLKNPYNVQLWDNRIQILKEQLFFRNMKRGLNIKNKVLALLSDLLKMQYLIHLKFSR